LGVQIILKGTQGCACVITMVQVNNPYLGGGTRLERYSAIANFQWKSKECLPRQKTQKYDVSICPETQSVRPHTPESSPLSNKFDM
jgi:hypothetical protein